MARANKTYGVVYERDEDGVWIVRIPEVRGCHSYGKSIAQARERIREALSLFVDDAVAEAAEFKEEFKLPAQLQKQLADYIEARRCVEELQELAKRSARALKKADFTVRDAGEVLKLSHQRIQQLLEGN